jgi:hypothetical protein
MKASEIAAQVTQTKTAHAMRLRRNQVIEKGKPIEYDAQPYFETGKKKGWIILDLFTASMLVKVHAALNEKSRSTWDNIAINKLIDFGWSCVK